MYVCMYVCVFVYIEAHYGICLDLNKLAVYSPN